jgi:hypothetical protein
MAKKATVKDVKVGEPQPGDATPPQSAAPAGGSLMGALAAMKKGGAKAEVTKTSKSGVVAVEIDEKKEPEIARAMRTFIIEDAKLKAAESRKQSAGDQLKEWAESKWFSLVRVGQQYLKTISLKGDINFGSGKLVVGKPNSEVNPPLTKEGIVTGLGGVDGIPGVFDKTEYAKYVKSTLILKVAAEINKGMLEPILSKEDREKYVLPTIPASSLASTDATVAVIQLLQGKLGLPLFDLIFPSYDISIELRKDKPGDDGIVELKRDMALFPAIEKKVEDAMAKGLVAKWSGALTSQKNALAVAQEELLAEQKAIEDAKQKGLLVFAAAAAAGAAAAQKTA